jgi:hypothetical protein
MAYSGNESDDWPNLVSATNTPALLNFQKFAQPDSLSSISVCAHDLVCTGLDALKNKKAVSVVSKISIYPTPGKAKILRSSGDVGDDGSASFPFHRQAAELGMSMADMRGRNYAQGYSPVISIEVSIDNKMYVGKGEIYLPGIFTLLEDDILTLPIQLVGESPGFEQASFLLDVKCHPAGKIVKKRKPQAITMWTYGMSNKALKSGSLEATLSCCDESGRDAQQLHEVKVNKKATEFENYFQLTSIWPEGDVLTVKIFDDKDTEYGHITVPVSAIMNGSLTEKKAYRIFSMNGKEIVPLENYMLCSMETIDADDVQTDLGVKKAPPMDEDEGPEFDEEQGGAGANAATGGGGSPEALNSLGGRLLGCVQGFTSELSDVISGRQRYIAEVCLLPSEGSAQSPWAEQTQACAPHAASKNRSGVEWGKSFELPVAYALQQRYALHLTIQLFEESSKGGKKRCLGESCFDIVSLVSVRGAEIMTFYLPVFTPDSAKLVPSARKEIGKFVVAVQFMSEKIFAPGSVPSDTLASTANLNKTATNNFTNTNFSALSDTRGSRTPGKSPGGRSVATAVGQYSGTNASGATTTGTSGAAGAGASGSLSHSEVANAGGSFWQALMNDDLKESPVSVFIQFAPLHDAGGIVTRFGDELTLVVDSMAESFETKLNLDDFEDTLAAAEDASFSINTQARETAVALNVCLGRNGNACCECWIVLSKASLNMGLPIQLDLPLRDSKGMKVAVLRLGSHTNSPELSVSRSVDALRVTFEEGHVSDPTWPNPLELYFECTMVAHREYKGDVSQVLQGRTNWAAGGLARKSKEVDIAQMQCTVDLPLDAVPEAYAKRVPSGAPSWSLTVVGRDASRPGAPALVTGNVNLSWPLFTKDKTTHERFMLRNASTGRALPVTMMFEKIKKGSGAMDAGSDGFEGVGSALFWMHGAQFPREDTPSPIDNAQVSVRWSRGNELSGQPFDEKEGGGEEDNSDGISSAMFATVVSLQQTRGDLSKPLITSVPLPGGFSDLKLSVNCGDGTYSTLLPALAAVSKGDSANVLDLPKFNVMMAKDGVKPGRGNQGVSPRLQFSMVFVPYVVGKLVLSIQDVRLDMTPGSWVLQPGNKRAALRFTVGTLSNKFSSQFTIKEVFNAAPPASKAKGGNKSSSGSLFGDQTGGDKSTSKFRKNMNKTGASAGSGVPIMSKPEVIEILMSTFDLLNCPGVDGNEEPLDLRCSVLDLESLPSATASAGGAGSSSGGPGTYVRAMGSLSTAALYYMAMRDAISQPPTPVIGSGRKGGTSPEAAVVIPLMHPGTGEQIGTINGSIKFCMFGGAEDVIEDIASHIKQAGSVETSHSECGAELGLKQAYAAADRDQSGGISRDELITIFMTIKSEVKKGKSSIVGLDANAIKAMSSLMNVLDGDDSNDDENNLDVSNEQFKAYLEEFFTKLDLDGDGTVTWWEWRQVLYAASLIRNGIVVKYMDHMDPLIVCYLAAHHGLEALRSSDPSSQLQTTTADLASHRMISWGDGRSGEADRLLAELRKKNSELEDALRNAGHGNDAEANARIRIAREEADTAKRLLDAERSRANRLQSEIDGMAGTSNALGKSRSDLEDENERARNLLAEHGAKSKERIALAHWQRKKKSHAIDMVRRSILGWINRHRKKKLTEGDLDGLMGVIPSLAATRIQKMHRGNLGRARAKKHWSAIAVIQMFCRKRKEMRAHRSAFADFVLEMHKATMKIQSAFRNVQMRRQGKNRKANQKTTEAQRRAALMAELGSRTAFTRAATRIQTAFRTRLAWRDLMARLSGKKVEVVDVIPAEKPILNDVLSYWIRMPAPAPTPTQKQKQNKNAEPRQGFVNNVNVAQKELSIVFEDSSNMKEEIVKYDNPDLLWFQEKGVLVERDGVPKRMNVSNMYDTWLIAADKPVCADAKNHWVRVNNNPNLHLSTSPRTIERQYYYGYVVSVNEQANSIGVFFDELNRVESVSFTLSASDLLWYHELLEPEAKKIINALDGKEEHEAEP